jgi:hypothetical protein
LIDLMITGTLNQSSVKYPEVFDRQ